MAYQKSENNYFDDLTVNRLRVRNLAVGGPDSVAASDTVILGNGVCLLPASASGLGYQPPVEKGIIITGDGTSSVVLPPGADGLSLILDSTEDEGMRWGAIDHDDLLNNGTNSHADIDAFIASKNLAGGLAGLNDGVTPWSGSVGPMLASRAQPGARSWGVRLGAGTYSNDGAANGGNGPTITNYIEDPEFPDTVVGSLDGGVTTFPAGGINLTTGIWTCPVNGTFVSDVAIRFPEEADNGPGQKFRQVALHSNVKGLQLDTNSMASILANKADYLKMTTLFKAEALEQFHISTVSFGPAQPDEPTDTHEISYVTWHVVQLFEHD